MANKESKESLHTMSLQELQARLKECRETSFRLQFQHTSNPLKNPMEIRAARRQLARVLTVLREKEKVA
jgi:large subunit ribosomal protein L29